MLATLCLVLVIVGQGKCGKQLRAMPVCRLRLWYMPAIAHMMYVFVY